ncbi:uncharacterized protein LOC134529474 [Bacillus rossius redtenbacheri]|uniref:uncharacterized protein LOC134529474 n=1 Tax=Bacillus rossius redtenbacheri TaxID=93214 RepID=UPI002FDDB0A1
MFGCLNIKRMFFWSVSITRTDLQRGFACRPGAVFVFAGARCGSGVSKTNSCTVSQEELATVLYPGQRAMRLQDTLLEVLKQEEPGRDGVSRLERESGRCAVAEQDDSAGHQTLDKEVSFGTFINT